MAKTRRPRLVIRKILKKKQGGQNLYGIKQGVGKVTRFAFPKRRNGNGAKKSISVICKHSLNAMHPTHLPLPRAVGGYTVIRTTDIVNTQREAMLFGCFKGPGNQFTETCWLSVIGVSNAGPGVLDSPINDPTGGGSANFYGSAALREASLNSAKMVPAAISVQVMNGDPLQTTAGIAYIGRAKTVLDLMGDTRTWNDVMKELVAFSAPRLCAAGKLALRGVQVNAIPNNLSVISDFVPRRNPDEGGVQRHVWTEDTFPCDFEGFGPIFIYNPDGIALKYLVTIEWRMRFDPLNPAYAGHTMHAPASESTWHSVISAAEAAGNGVMDIADVTADIGMAALGAAPFML
jgi:hypothetical protein